MESNAFWVTIWVCIGIALFVSVSVAVFVPLMMSTQQWRAAEDRAHKRRLADARMNARLLRLNL